MYFSLSASVRCMIHTTIPQIIATIASMATAIIRSEVLLDVG